MTNSLLQARSTAFLWNGLSLSLPRRSGLFFNGQNEVAMEACSCERILLTLGGSADKEAEKLNCIHSIQLAIHLLNCPIRATPIAMALASLVPPPCLKVKS